MRRQDQKEKARQAVAYIEKALLIPYRWGGDDPIGGFDCSGLVVEMLKSNGMIKENEDYTADGLMRKYPKVNRPEIGVLVLYGTQQKAVHVGICLDHYRMIEAGGGGSNTQTDDDAERQNAFIKIRPINRRSDFLCFVDPFIDH